MSSALRWNLGKENYAENVENLVMGDYADIAILTKKGIVVYSQEGIPL